MGLVDWLKNNWLTNNYKKVVPIAAGVIIAGATAAVYLSYSGGSKSSTKSTIVKSSMGKKTKTYVVQTFGEEEGEKTEFSLEEKAANLMDNYFHLRRLNDRPITSDDEKVRVYHLMDKDGDKKITAYEVGPFYQFERDFSNKRSEGKYPKLVPKTEEPKKEEKKK